MTHYEILGVSRNATPDEIKKAYRRLSRKYHPDVSEEPDAHERFQEIATAYATLSDPVTRDHYDLTGSDKPPKIVEEARQIVCQEILKWVEANVDDANPFYGMRESVLRAIENILSRATQNLQHGENIINKHRRVLGRLKFKGNGVDYVGNALRSMIEGNEQKCAEQRICVERIRLAKEMVSDYDWENPFQTPNAPTVGIQYGPPLFNFLGMRR